MNINTQIQYIQKHRPKIAVMPELKVAYKSANDIPVQQRDQSIHVHHIVDALQSDIEMLKLRLTQAQSRYLNLEIALQKSIELSQMLLKDRK